MQNPNIKQKMRKKHVIINKRKPIKVICPYCNKEGQTGAMHIWHFEKCKHKPKKL